MAKKRRRAALARRVASGTAREAKDRHKTFTHIDYSRYMDTQTALEGLSALAQETRLQIFRLLIGQGEPGLPAGDIAEAVAGRQNTISTHLAILARAGLIRGERDGRVIRYSADFAAARGLIGFLLEDCCDGRPEICVPLLGTLDCLNQPAQKAGQGGNCDVC